MWEKIMAVHIEKKIIFKPYARHFEIIIKECMQRKTRR